MPYILKCEIWNLTGEVTELLASAEFSRSAIKMMMSKLYPKKKKGNEEKKPRE